MNLKKYNPSKEIMINAEYASIEDYNTEYSRSIKENDDFWNEKAERLDWFKKWKK